MRKANLAHRVVAAALVLGILAFSAPRASNAAAPHAGMKTLRWWQNYGDVWPNSLDPAVGTNTLTIYNIALIHANLVTFDYYKNGSFGMKGDLASHWKISKNRKVWTFFIRPNARFSNGHDVTAQDVKFSFSADAQGTSLTVTYTGTIEN